MTNRATVRFATLLVLMQVMLFSIPLQAIEQIVDLDKATVADVQAAMSTGKLSAEKSKQLYLQRIAAYDKQGPSINAVILLNPKAIDTARALDKERKAGKVRGPLHGIPIILKDNYDTYDLQTTAGSQTLLGSVPKTDAFVVNKQRE